MKRAGPHPRLTFVLFLSTFFVVAGCVFSIFSIRVAKRNIVSIYNDRVLPLEQLKELTDAYSIDIIASSQKALNRKISWDSAAHVITKAKHNISTNWKEYLATYLTSDEKRIIKQADSLKLKADRVTGQILKILNSARTNQYESELKQVVEDDLYPGLEPFLGKINELIDIQTQEAGNLKSLVEKIFTRIIILALLTILMGVLIILLIRYRSRLEELVQKQAKELADAYDELYCTNEELQTSNEELDAANQEYSMINEQLNLTNEELHKHKNDLETIISDRMNDLVESEERYRTLVNNIMQPFIVTTFESQLLFTNQMGANFFGFNAQNLSNYTFSKFWVDLLHRQKFIEKLKNNGFVKNEEIELYNSQDEIATVIVSSTIIDYYGVKAIFSVFNDITERKRIENELIESEIKLNTVIESTANYIWAVDSKEFKIIVFNSAIGNEFLRNNVRMRIGATIEELMPEHYVKFWYDAYEKVLIHGKYEIEYNTAYGSRILNLSFNPLKKDDQIIGISVFGLDITEKRKAEEELIKSEERFRVTFEKAGIGVALVDMEGRPVKSNPKLQEMLGYSQEELAGMPFTDFTHTDDISKDWELYSNLIKGNIKSYQMEKRFIRKDGGIVWVNLTASMVWSSDGSPLYGIGLVEDMTEKKEMDRQILTSVINTEENERLHFSEELHDGLGPLISAIKMYIQLLGMPNSKMDHNEIISNVERLIDEASNSIREISFKLSPHILVNFGIIEALNAYINKVKQSNKITIDLTSENFCRLPETIEKVIYRVICECINNTIKHARAKQISIKLFCLNNNIEITYNDDGQGFEVERAISDTKGIGLLNMESRIKSINGDIIINSNKGEGTVVKIKVQIPDQ